MSKKLQREGGDCSTACTSFRWNVAQSLSTWLGSKPRHRAQVILTHT